MKRHYSVESMKASWEFVENFINSNYPFFFASVDSSLIKNSDFGYNTVKVRFSNKRDLNGYLVYTVSQDEDNLKQFALSLSSDVLFVDKEQNAFVYNTNGVISLGIFNQDIFHNYFDKDTISFKMRDNECLPKALFLNQIDKKESIAFICTDEGIPEKEYIERDPDEDTVFSIINQLIPIADFQSYDLECKFGNNLYTEAKAIYSCKETELKEFSIALIRKFHIDYFLFKDSNNDFYQVFSNGLFKKLGTFSYNIDKFFSLLGKENFSYIIVHHNNKGGFLEIDGIPSFTGYAKLTKLREKYLKTKNPEVINEFVF